MRLKKPELAKLALLLFLLLVIFLVRPIGLQRDPRLPPVSAFLTSLAVDQSAGFHPLLRSGTLNPVDNPKLKAVAVYLAVNAQTGEVYSAKNATDKISPASLTKLMTAMVALDLASPSARLTASANAALEEPTELGFLAGETFTLAELVRAMIMTSANDAATVVGEETLKPLGGNQTLFIELMNKKAELLGLGRTRFANTQGFDDPNQFSNAYDLARIGHYASSHYPLVREAAATPYATLPETAGHGFYHLPNWNALLGTYPGVNGLKIGYTESAGYSTIVTASKSRTSLIIVIIGADSIINRDLAAATLLNFAFAAEGEKGVTVNQDLIEPRLDEWRQLREDILDKLRLEKSE